MQASPFTADFAYVKHCFRALDGDPPDGNSALVRGKFVDQDRGNFNGASPTGPPWKPPAIGFQAVLEEGHLAAPTVCAPKDRKVTCSKIMIDHDRSC